MRKVAEVESPDFPKRVKEYLDERFKGEPFYRPYEIHVGDILEESLSGEELKWSVQLWSFGCCAVEEDAKGQIWALSHGIETIDGWIEDYWRDGLDSSQLKVFLRDLQDKKNWRKYDRKYRKLMARLRFGEKIAELVTKKTGVKVVLFIPSDIYFKYCRFYSVFDANDMTDDQKMEEIKKRADAVFLAYKSWDEGKEKLYRRRTY
jgi:hypothetical protein